MRRFLLAAMLALFAPAAAARGEDAAALDQRVLFFSPQGPVLLSLQIRIDGSPLHDARTAYAERLFVRADADKDGAVSRPEWGAVLPTLSSDPRSSKGSDQWETVDQDPEDGRVSRDEFVAEVRSRLGSAVEVGLQPARPEQQVNLFVRLDRDGDRRLSADEFARAGEALRKLDLDEDETYSLGELGPFRDPLRPSSATRPADGPENPFLALPAVGSLDAAIIELARRCGASAGSPGAVRLAREHLRIEAEQFEAFDADTDGALGRGELARWLRDGEPEARLAVSLPNNKPVAPKLAATDAAGADLPGSERKRVSEVVARVAGVPIEMRVLAPPVTGYDALQFFRLQFRKADGDTNGYVDEAEFGGVGLPGANFGMVDTDGDEMVYEREIVEHVRGRVDRAANGISMMVAREGRTLFEVLDRNRDRRLSPRELAAARDVVAEVDQDRDGALADGELAERYRVTFRMDSGGLLEAASRSREQGMAPEPVRIGATSGPAWFRSMDRNADGDVSRREFLGPTADFNRLDGDGDGLLDPDEAARAGG